MTTPRIELAVAVLRMTRLSDRTYVYRFVEAVGQNTDPYHQALQKLRTVLCEHPQVSHELVINERALDAATVTMMHAAGFTDYTLLDAEQTQQALDDAEDQP
ncbi:hypothetical protein [Kocuria sp. CPCC 205263]|uniref:hypothetical protein n=1 Tax=Kocuria sp. CPCC 205263 TaxID=3073555 RepID=UPI0034D3F914